MPGRIIEEAMGARGCALALVVGEAASDGMSCTTWWERKRTARQED
jgi:hypothetical protein